MSIGRGDKGRVVLYINGGSAIKRMWVIIGRLKHRELSCVLFLLATLSAVTVFILEHLWTLDWLICKIATTVGSKTTTVRGGHTPVRDTPMCWHRVSFRWLNRGEPLISLREELAGGRVEGNKHRVRSYLKDADHLSVGQVGVSKYALIIFITILISNLYRLLLFNYVKYLPLFLQVLAWNQW